MSILIIDYGMGNLSSIANMIKKVGGVSSICSNLEQLDKAEKLILPGVGSFDHGITSLLDNNWKDVLDNMVKIKRVPVLGICLGMQLMCNNSEEGRLSGLGWIDAQIRRFSFPEHTKLKVPHMGWNTVDVTKPNPLLDSVQEEQRFYFVHSFHAVCADPADVLATAHHGYDFCAAFSRDNIFGVQFHPEKSHRFGMELMKRFVDLR